ncbi:MAG: DUF2062 domain-containing protein [Deltaproteobacteria bacterium]|nr:DUF2062 domain-containing protein [Deltaproteobacteria bacterium]
MIQEIRKNHLRPRRTRVVKSLKKIYDRFLRIRGEPRYIALGFALGLFIGMSPTMGIQTYIAIFFAALLKWNKISAAIGVWISNPITFPLIYSFTYITGAKLLGIKKAIHPPVELDQSISAFAKFLQKAPEVIWALVLGGIILGIPVAVAGYYITNSAVLRYQRDIKRKIERRKEMRARKRREKKYDKKNVLTDQETLP